MKKIFAIMLSLSLMISPVALAQNSGDQFRENPDSKKKDSYMKQITSIVTAGVGMTAIASCKTASFLPSLLIFNAGSIIYIASELLGGKSQNAFHKKKASDMKMLEEKMKNNVGGDVQKEALETALKDEKETLAVINKRMKWLGAIRIVYSLATIAAVLEVLKMAIPFMQPPGQLGICTPEGLAATKAVQIGLKAAYTYAAVKNSSGMDMYAKMGVMLAITFTGLGPMLVGAMNSAPTRVAMFGVATMDVMGNLSDLKEKAKVAKENIEMLEKVIAQFNQDTAVTNTLATGTTSGANSGSSSGSTSGVQAGQTSGSTGGSSGGINSGGSTGSGGITGGSTVGSRDIVRLDDGISPSDPTCLSQGSQGFEFSGNCRNPVKIDYPKFDQNMNLPTLQAASLAASDMAQAVSKGDLAAADVAAGTLNSMAGRIEKMKESVMKQAMDTIKKENRPIDFEKDQKDFLSSRAAALEKSIKEGGPEVAAFSGSNIGTLPALSAEELGLEVNSASSEKTIDANSASRSSGVSSISESNSNMPSEKINEGGLNAKPDTAKSFSEYETSVEDISKKSEESLFKQVSNRYMSNYDKFFKRKEVKEVPVAE